MFTVVNIKIVILLDSIPFERVIIKLPSVLCKSTKEGEVGGSLFFFHPIQE
jgi:hypothetical protein